MKKIFAIKKLILFLILVILLFFSLTTCFAEESVKLENPGKITLDPKTKFSSLEEILYAIPPILRGIAGVIFIAMLVIGGYQYMTSAGNQETAEKAKKSLIWAVVGIIIVALSIPLVSFIQNKVLKTSPPKFTPLPTTNNNSQSTPSVSATNTKLKEYTVYPNNFVGPLPEKSVIQKQVYPDNFIGPLPEGAIYQKQVKKYVDINGNEIDPSTGLPPGAGETDLYSTFNPG